MSVTLIPGQLAGEVIAPSSKSMSHRLLICMALSRSPITLKLNTLSDDILSTVRCLRALGAEIGETEGALRVQPVSSAPVVPVELFCGESGSTLRFLLPLAGALGVKARFHMEGRLPERPLFPLDRELTSHGMSIERHGEILSCGGRLVPGEYTLSGNVSSQYISGLLMALPMLDGDSRLTVTGKIESASYINMTMDVLTKAGAGITDCGHTYFVPGGKRFKLPASLSVEGDYSGVAFMLAAGALSSRGVRVSGLSFNSCQGDGSILELLRRFGARVESDGDSVTTSAMRLRGIDIDASQIPDLVPILCVLAAAAEGETRITGAARLRLKESDRIRSTAAMLRALGGSVDEMPDGLAVRGGRLTGGSVCTQGDHRIAMAAAIAACICSGNVEIDDADCVKKSYPKFWNDRAKMGGKSI